MSPKQKNIVAVYHKYAACPPLDDVWSRLHVHGLDIFYLYKYGFENEKTLVKDFKRWLNQFQVIAMYANDPSHEHTKLGFPIMDIALPKWIERVKYSYHKVPQHYKLQGKPFCHIVCDENVHSEFVFTPLSQCTTKSQLVKASHGFHCSLADVHELYLFYLETRT